MRTAIVLLSGWLQSSGGAAVVPNFVVVVPGARNLSTDGGSVGSVLVYNLSSAAVDLPVGWQLGLSEFPHP